MRGPDQRARTFICVCVCVCEFLDDDQALLCPCVLEPGCRGNNHGVSFLFF